MKKDLPRVEDVIQERCGGTEAFWQDTKVLVVMKDEHGYCIGHGNPFNIRFVRLCDVGVTWRWPPEPCPTCGHLSQ